MSSHCINLHLHRSSHPHTEQTKPAMGVYDSNGRLGLGKQRIFLPSRVCLTNAYVQTRH